MIVVEAKQWKQLHAELSQLGHSAYKVSGTLQEGIAGHLELIVAVDKWPDFVTVIIANSKKMPAYISNTFSLFTIDSKAFNTDILTENPFIDWNDSMVFCGVNVQVAPAVSDLLTHRGCLSGVDVIYLMMELRPERLPVADSWRLPSGYEMDRLRACDVDAVVTSWAYSNPTAAEYVFFLLQHFESRAARRPARHHGDPPQLAGWVLQTQGGSLGLLHVLEADRGRGLGKALVADLAASLVRSGRNPYVYVERNNATSLALHRACGFELVPGQDAQWLKYAPARRP